MSTDTIDLLIELAENEGSSHYGDACREAVAALTAAAERETKLNAANAENYSALVALREENARLRREADCHVSAESALETLARAETAEAEVERLNGELDKLAITLSHEAHARAAECQKVQALREWLERNEGNGKRTSDELLLLLVVKAKMDAIGLGGEGA